MIKYLKMLLIFSSLLFSPAFAEEDLITDAGREVTVNDDGSWSFVSDDRYATNATGDRIKLKSDGTWEVLSIDENLTTQHDAVYRNSSSYSPVEFSISRAVIEKSETKTSGSSKNTHVKTQTLFYISVSVPNTEFESHQLNAISQFVSVADSADRQYDLLNITPSSLTVAPGESEVLTIVIDDAPSWKLGKSYDVTISADILLSDNDVVLRIPLSEVKQIDVDELTVF